MSEQLDNYDGKFSWFDYLFFSVMLLISTFIGIYYGFYKKQKTVQDYLLGGKKLGAIPVAMSLLANNMSGVALLAIPSEIYRYGVTMWFTYPAIIVVTFLCQKLYIPVFYKLQTISIFEYLKIRYDTKTRKLSSLLNLIGNIFFLPIVIYVPALALEQSTGINVHLISCLVCFVCIFYTTIGGSKAVVYSDSIQFVVMAGSLATVFILGILSVGFENIWITNYEHHRLDISFDLNPMKRDTIWTICVGNFTLWLGYSVVNQVFVQKCLSLPSDKEITVTLIAYAGMFLIMGSMIVFSGLIMFATFVDCDPVKSGWIKEIDQLIPLFVNRLSKTIPGLAGLFQAGIFSASLSTLASGLNSLAGNIYEDFIAKYMNKDITQRKISFILKCIVCFLGVLCTALVLLVERLGSILALTVTITSVYLGPVLGLFTGGMFIPMINSTGAFYAEIITCTFMSIIVVGAQWNHVQDMYPKLPVSTEGCSYFNGTEEILNTNDTFVLFKISQYWYTFYGMVICLILSIVISLFTKDDKDKKNADCFSPVIHRFLPKDYEVKSEHLECFLKTDCNCLALNNGDQNKIGK